MKRIICLVLVALMLFSLTACSGNGNIVGIWEQEMETTILGAGEPASAASLCRFTFREDATGIQEHIITDGSHPDAVREFTYSLEGDILLLDFGGGQTEKFTVLLNKTSLQLDNSRGSYDLTRAE